MGNEPTKHSGHVTAKSAGNGIGSPVQGPAPVGVARPGSPVPDEVVQALDPKIRQFLDGSAYTVASKTRSSSSTAPGDGELDAPTEGPVVVSTGDTWKDKDPVMIQIEAIPKALPLYASDKYKRLMSPGEAAQRSVRAITDINPLMTLLNTYQSRLSAASVQISKTQDGLNVGHARLKVKCWTALNLQARAGVDMNVIESHASELYSMKNVLEQSRTRVFEVVRKMHYLLDAIPASERTPDLAFPVELAPYLERETYLKLNYYKETPSFQDISTISEQVRSRDERHESFWIYEIIPFWNYAVVQKRALAVWRRGIPPKLRAFIWKKAVGNKLQITRELYETLRKSIKDYQKSATENHTSPRGTAANGSSPDPSKELTVTILTEDEEPTSTPTQTIISPEETKPMDIQGLSSSSGEEKQALVSSFGSEPGGEQGGEYITPKPKESTHKQRIVSLHSSRKDVRKLIEMDLKRTLAKLKLFSEPSHQAHDDALTLLLAVATNNPQIGYLQGMTYLAAMLLLYMDAADAFICLSNLLESHLFYSLCKVNLQEVAKHTQLYQIMLAQNLPALQAHFSKLGISDEHYIFDWYLTLFAKTLNINTAARIWDGFFLEGPIFIHMATIGILKVYESQLLGLSFEGTLDFIRRLPEEIDEKELFGAIDRLTVAPYLVEMVDKLNNSVDSNTHT